MSSEPFSYSLISKFERKKCYALLFCENFLYIKKTFKNYVEYDRDLENLCNAINDYSNGKTDFSNHVFVKVKKLSNLDLYHFGWNVWNHFKVVQQDETALFLKTIFRENLSNVAVETIKSHLRDDENKGIVKIKEDLSKSDDE